MCYDTYALLLEYAILGEDYDSMAYKFGLVIENLQYELELCDNQQEYLEEIIAEMNAYILTIEKKLAKRERKLKIMRVVGYSSLGANAILTLILILKP